MFFEKPKLDSSSLYVKPPEPNADDQSSFVDVAKAYEDEIKKSGNTFSTHHNLWTVYDEHNKRVKELTGVEFENPADENLFVESAADRRRQFNDDLAEYRRSGGTLSTTLFLRQWQERDYRQRLEELASKRPELRDDILPDQSFRSLGYAERGKAIERAREVWERSDKGVLSGLAWLGGSLYGGFQDPVNLAATLVGFGWAGAGAKGLLTANLKNGLANAAVEAAVQPTLQAEQNRAGLPSGLDQAALAVGSAFLLGSGIDLVARGGYRGFRHAFGFKPVVNDGVIVGWRRPTLSPPERPGAPTARLPEAPEIPSALAERARNGDKDAQAEITKLISGEDVVSAATMERAANADVEALREVLGPAAETDPVIRHGLDAMEADEALRTKPIDIIPDDEHARVLSQTARHLEDPNSEPLPAYVDSEPRAPGVADGLRKELDDLRKEIGEGRATPEIEARVAEIEGQLRSIDRFGLDPIADAESLRVNGGVLTTDIDTRFPGPRQAVALSRLSDEAFGMVRRGEAPKELGEIVAQYVPQPEAQARVLSDLTKLGPVSPEEARLMTARLLERPDGKPRVEPVKEPVTERTGNIRTLDDPYGKEAKAQVKNLEADLAEELAAGGRSVDPVEALATPEGRALAITRADAVRAAIRDLTGIVPPEVQVRVFDGLDDMPETLRLRVEAGNAAAFGKALDDFLSARSLDERATARQALEVAERGESAEGFYVDGTIWLASYAMNPRGRFAHEVVHALRALDRLTQDEVSILARAGRESGLFSERREALYREAYQDRRLSEEGMSRLLDEEAAAHYLEAHGRGEVPETLPVEPRVLSIAERIGEFFAALRRLLMGQGFRAKTDDTPFDPARDVATAILMGEVARREAGAKAGVGNAAFFALRSADDDAASFPTAMRPENGRIVPAFHASTSPQMFHTFDPSFAGTAPLGAGAAFPGSMSFSRLAGINGIDGAWTKGGQTSYIYDVDIDTTAMAVPDFAKPFSEQTPEVQSILKANENVLLNSPHKGGKIIFAGGAQFDQRNPSHIASARLAAQRGDRIGAAAMLRTEAADMTRRERKIYEEAASLVERGGEARRDVFAGRNLAHISNSFSHEPALADMFDVIRYGEEEIVVLPGAMDRVKIRSVYDVKNRRTVREPLFALRDAETGRSMRDDIDALGYYSGALRAAKALRQNKGTPEQMLAMLKKEGAKEAELEATGLMKWFGSRESGDAADSGAVTETVKLYRGVPLGRSATETADTTGNALFYAPDRAVAEAYAGKDGNIIEHEVTFRNLLKASNWHEAAKKLGSDKPVPMGDLIQMARAAGYDGLTFKTKWGDEYIHITDARTNGDRTAGMSGSAGRLKQPSITKSEIVEFLEHNRVSINEVTYGANPSDQRRLEELIDRQKQLEAEHGTKAFGMPEYVAASRESHNLSMRMMRDENQTKYSGYSLDPGNPTYRETVIYLPEVAGTEPAFKVTENGQTIQSGMSREEAQRYVDANPTFKLEADGQLPAFRPGHFPEPNITGHMMTSMTSHEGRPVYTIDQIQSDWGQKLRNGGVRDEAKIAKLKEDADAATKRSLEFEQQWLKARSEENFDEAYRINKEWNNAATEADRLNAELATAEAAASDHPLVNTTDQWVNTTLRRALRQAAEADAEYIAIPSGKTVLSYNPGDEAGMEGFYNGIVPKNLRNILKKIDKESPDAVRVEKLETPTQGLKGEGFTLFPLTPTVKQKVIEEGLPIFALRSADDDAASFRAAKAHGSGTYLTARGGRDGYGVTETGQSRLLDVTPASLIRWSAAEQSPEITRGINAVAFANGITLKAGATGEDLYRTLAAKLGERHASRALAEAGVPGAIIEDGAIRKMVIYDEGVIRDDPIEASRSASDLNPEAETVLPPDETPLIDTDQLQAAVAQIQQAAGSLDPETITRLSDPETVSATVPLVQDAIAAQGIEIDPQAATRITSRVLSEIAAGGDPREIIGREIAAYARPAAADEGSGPLFALRDESGRLKRGAARRAEALSQDLAQIEQDLAASAIGERDAFQRKRASYLNAKAEEAGLDDIEKYRSPRGREDLATAFLRLHESFGTHNAPFSDLVTLREYYRNKALEIFAEGVFELRKGAVLGDLRRMTNAKVRALMDNMIREAAGEKTGDELASRLAKAWIKAAEYLRQSFNARGGDIGKLQGWFAPQWHDPEALIKAGRDTWVAYLMQDGVLDRTRMLNGDGNPLSEAEMRDMLRNVWWTITSDGARNRDVTDAFGKGALYKRHAEHRVLHFKSGDAYLKYAREFGGADIYAMMMGHFEMMSRDIAALERFGANPEIVRERLKQHILLDAKESRSARSLYDDLSDKVSDLRTDLKMATSAPVDNAMARIARIHTELDRIRGKSGLDARRETLRRQLFTANQELLDALTFTGATQRQTELVGEISAHLDEMDRMSQSFAIMDRNSEQYARYAIRRADEMWKAYTGATSVPAHNLAAGAMQAARNYISASMLPAASISALSDQATGLAARAFIGMPVTRQLNSFIRAFSQKDRKFALRAGLGLDQARAAFVEANRYTGGFNPRSVTGYLADRTHAFSFLSPMTQAAKVGFGIDFMTWMADLASQTPFDKLSAPVRRMMDRHGFSAADYEALSRVTPEIKDGVPILTREAVEAGAGDEIAERYMRMLYRERSLAVIEPTLQGRTAIVSDTQPGTIIGEMTRSVAMLKSFPTTYMMLILGRLQNEYLAGRIGTSSTAVAAAYLFVGGSILGALAMQLKGINKGQDAQDMTDPKFWPKAFLQGGGLGIYGDFVFNSVNRQGGSLAQTLAGPLASEAQLLTNLTLGNALQFAQDEPTNAGRELTSYIRQRTPVLPFYLRQVYERMVLDELQRMTDPDAYQSFRRRIQSQKKLGGNEFYWPPGSPVAQRAPDIGRAFGAR